MQNSGFSMEVPLRGMPAECQQYQNMLDDHARKLEVCCNDLGEIGSFIRENRMISFVLTLNCYCNFNCNKTCITLTEIINNLISFGKKEVRLLSPCSS